MNYLYSARRYLGRMCSVFLFALLMISPAVRPVSATEFTFLPEQRGTTEVKVEKFPATAQELGAAGAAAFETAMEKLRSRIMAQPVFNPPIGFRVTGYMRADHNNRIKPKAPLPGQGYIQFFPAYVHHKTGKPAFFAFTTDEMSVHVNNPCGGLDSFNFNEGGVNIYYDPVPVGSLGGYPVFKADLDSELIVMSRSGKLPWVPFTQEEFINMYIKFWQKSADNSGGDKLSMGVVAAHKAALARMTPAERRKQARYGGQSEDPMEPLLSPPDSTEGIPLVKADPAWFDPALPRSAFQLITVRFWYTGAIDLKKPGPSLIDGSISPFRVWEALHKSDWAAIGAALEKK